MYKFIFDPNNNKKIILNSKKGKKVLDNYLNYIQMGGLTENKVNDCAIKKMGKEGYNTSRRNSAQCREKKVKSDTSRCKNDMTYIKSYYRNCPSHRGYDQRKADGNKVWFQNKGNIKNFVFSPKCPDINVSKISKNELKELAKFNNGYIDCANSRGNFESKCVKGRADICHKYAENKMRCFGNLCNNQVKKKLNSNLEKLDIYNKYHNCFRSYNSNSDDRIIERCFKKSKSKTVDKVLPTFKCKNCGEFFTREHFGTIKKGKRRVRKDISIKCEEEIRNKKIYDQMVKNLKSKINKIMENRKTLDNKIEDIRRLINDKIDRKEIILESEIGDFARKKIGILKINKTNIEEKAKRILEKQILEKERQRNKERKKAMNISKIIRGLKSKIKAIKPEDCCNNLEKKYKEANKKLNKLGTSIRDMDNDLNIKITWIIANKKFNNEIEKKYRKLGNCINRNDENCEALNTKIGKMGDKCTWNKRRKVCFKDDPDIKKQLGWFTYFDSAKIKEYKEKYYNLHN